MTLTLKQKLMYATMAAGATLAVILAVKTIPAESASQALETCSCLINGAVETLKVAKDSCANACAALGGILATGARQVNMHYINEGPHHRLDINMNNAELDGNVRAINMQRGRGRMVGVQIG